eukprot:5649976-Amphidinium_carterae.1
MPQAQGNKPSVHQAAKQISYPASVAGLWTWPPLLRSILQLRTHHRPNVSDFVYKQRPAKSFKP